MAFGAVAHRADERLENFSSGPTTAVDQHPVSLVSQEDSAHPSRVLRRPHQPKSASQASSVRSSDSSLQSPLSSRLVTEEFGERGYYHHARHGLERRSRRPTSARSSPSSECPSPATEISMYSSTAGPKARIEDSTVLIDVGPTSGPDDHTSQVTYKSSDLDSPRDPPLATPTLFSGYIRQPTVDVGYGDEGTQTVRADELSKDMAARLSGLQMEAPSTRRPVASSADSTARSPTSMSFSTGTWRTSTSSNPTTAYSDGMEIAKLNPFGVIDDDDDDVVGTFLTPMQPLAIPIPPAPLGKPKLTVQTDTTDGGNHPPSRLATQGGRRQQQPSTTTSGSLSIPSPTALSRRGGDRRTSFTGDDWAVRPAVDEVYEHLEQFFPHHDLDKPIDIGPLPPLSPVDLSPSASPSPRPVSTCRLNGRARSIRVVAQEKKRLLRRSDDRRPTAGMSGSALLRRKSTKLWGARIEEVTPGMGLSIPSAIDELGVSSRDEDPDNC